MFSQRQIALGGFLSIYAGCAALSVNFLRMRYRRGAYVGLFFGSLMQLFVAMADFWIIAAVAGILDDPQLLRWESRCVCAGAALCVQLLCAAGCAVMARYFLAPKTGRDTFSRDALLFRLEKIDTGKRSVVHDIVGILRSNPAVLTRHISTFWLILLSFFAACAFAAWLKILTDACLSVIFFGVPVDAEWYAGVAGLFLIPLLLLILVEFSVFYILSRS